MTVRVEAEEVVIASLASPASEQGTPQALYRVVVTAEFLSFTVHLLIDRPTRQELLDLFLSSSRMERPSTLSVFKASLRRFPTVLWKHG